MAIVLIRECNVFTEQDMLEGTLYLRATITI